MVSRGLSHSAPSAVHSVADCPVQCSALERTYPSLHHDREGMNRINPRSVRVACLLVSLAVAGSACGVQGEDEPADATKSTVTGPTVEITSPSTGTSVKGNVVTLALKLDGLSVVAADGNTCGKSGHIHLFLDREPVAAGAAIPKEPGIVHTVDNPVRLTGLSVGKHDITVVLVDGALTRIGTAEDRVNLTVEGPSIDATAPHGGGHGGSCADRLQGDRRPDREGRRRRLRKDRPHPRPRRQAASRRRPAIPKPDDGSIIHTAESSVEIPNLAPGEHSFLIVLGDGVHRPIDPLVADNPEHLGLPRVASVPKSDVVRYSHSRVV